MWLINTYGNGTVLSDVFRSIVFLMGGGYESLLRLGMVCLVFGGIVSYLGRGRVHWQWAIGAVMILAVTMNIRTTIQVHDLVNPTNPDQVIGNVPLAVAFPAYLTSEISYQTMVGIETSFGLPAEYRVVNSTIGKGFFDMQKTFSLELVPGDLQANVTNYIKDCVFPAIQLNRLNRETLTDAADMATAIQVTVAALVTKEVLLGNQAGEMTCPDHWDKWVRLGLANGEPDYDETMRQFRAVLGVLDVADAELTPVQAFSTNIIGTAQGPRVLINNVLLRERWKNAEEAYAQDGSDTASAVVQMTRSLSEDLKNQAYNDSMVAARFVPLIRTVSESAVYLLTPLMLALAMSPAMFGTIRGAVISYGWLFMWIPMYAIFNFVTFQYGVQQMNMITVNQVTFSSYDQYYDVLLGLNTFMSRLVWAVPTLATVVTYGMSSAASSLTGAASGAQAAASQEASAYAHGEGRYIEPGQHLRLEEGPMVQDASGGYHAGASYFGGGTGTEVHRQDGTTSYSYSDGGSMMVGRNGVESYHGPEGSWSRQDGVYQAGVWRQEVQDSDGGHHLAQFEVSGDHVDVSYMTADDHGIQHDIRQTWNQSLNEQKSVSDTWSEGGFSKEILTHGDHSQRAMFKGTAPVPMKVNGRTEMVSAEVSGSFFRPSDDSPWGQGVMTAHSTEHGDFHYSLSNAQMDDRGFPDLSKGVTVSSSHGTDQKSKLSSDHGLFTATTEGGKGELTRTYLGQSDVEVFHKDGTHERLSGVVHGQGGVNEDGSGKPFQSSLTVDNDGYRGELRGEMSLNANTGQWELHQPTEEWTSKLESYSSGTTVEAGGHRILGATERVIGNRNDPHATHQWSGTEIDAAGNYSRATAEMRDGKLYYSNAERGITNRAIEDSGEMTITKGKVDSPEGAQYMKVTAASGWRPVGTDDQGHKLYEPISGQLTETGRVRAAGENGQLEHLPNDTRISGTSENGAFSIAVVPTSLPGSQVYRKGGLSTDIKTDGEQASLSGSTDRGIPIGDDSPVNVYLPVDGRIGRQLTVDQTHKEPDGTLTAERQTLDPYTNALARSRREGGESVSIENKRVDSSPVTIDNLHGVDGSVRAMSERVSDPNSPATPISESLHQGANADLLVHRKGQSGRLLAKLGDDGEWVGKFESLRTDEIQGHGKFAETITSNSSDQVLHEKGVAGESFLTQYNNREEHQSGTTLDSMGLVRDTYEAMGGKVTPGDDKFFRGIAYGLEAGRLTVDGAQRLLFLRNSISRAKSGGKVGGKTESQGIQTQRMRDEEDLSRERMRQGFEDMR